MGTCPLHAQSTAQINGSVHDPNGGLIPGAEIIATETETGVVKTTTSNSEGLYAFPSLSVGHYRIEAKAAGFNSYVQKGLVLTVSEEVKLDISLAIGAVEQVVEVTADSVQVDASTPTEQSTVEQAAVEGLPLNGRNPADLVKNVAGVTDTTLNVSATDTNSNIKPADSVNPLEFAPAIHGARAGGVYFSLDGATNTDPYTIIGGPFPNPDATGEFSVVTGAFGARYASAPGGAINIVSRSGTNKLHGTAFEFIRNGFFNARTPLDPMADVLKRNQFGVALGGPVLHDKLFLFGSVQDSPTHDNTVVTNYFPTAAMRTGNFGTFQIPNSVTIPGVGTINPMASATTGATSKLLSALPTPTSSDGYLAYDSPQIYNDQQALLKLEYTRGSNQFFARAFYDRYTLTPQGATSQALMAAEHQGYVMPYTTVAVGDTLSHKNWIFDSRASYILIQASQPMAPSEMTYTDLGISNLSGGSIEPGICTIYYNGLGLMVNLGAPMFIPRKAWEFSENAFLVKGKHQMSMGGSYRRVGINETGYAFRDPIVAYEPANSAILGTAGVFGANALVPGMTGNSLADMVMGMPYIFLQSDGFFINVSGNLFGLYGEDTYRVSKNLTLVGGVRWDPYLPYTSNGNRAITCFNTSLPQSKVFPNAYPGELFPGDTGCPDAGMPKTLGEFQPRVGLAYQVGSKGKTAIRMGYGRYDMQLPLKTFVGNASAAPWLRQYELIQPLMSIDNIWQSSGVNSNPFASGFHDGSYSPPENVAFAQHAQVSAFSQQFRPAYVQQWSLSVQQALSSKDMLDVSYVGTTGVHLTLGEDLNTPIYEKDPITGAAPSTLNENDRRPFPNYDAIGNMTSTGTSSYEGLDITFKHRSKSFSISPAFTWSKSLDDLSQPPMAGTVNVPNANHNFFRGRSDFDQNLDFRTTAMWTGPAFKNLNKAARTVAGGWTLSGLVTFDAGQPFSVADSSDNSMSGDSLDLADRVPNVPVWTNGKLNYAAFKDNAYGTWGNSGRNAYRSPSYKDIDSSLAKNFSLYERLNGTFRWEVFNLLNEANYLPPNSSYSTGAASFGNPTGGRPARVMQFSLKFAF